jgi:MoaA/NifB/PqqE/SkfB family radical SAM enzyme
VLTATLEISRRAASHMTGRLRSLPVLAMSVHSACNCRCVMCDIWKANAEKREISIDALERHLPAIRRLHVQRVMLTGGEPLLHSNLWRFCELLRAQGIHLTLVTTGLLLDVHAEPVARLVDHVVISIDGPPATHDAIRRVRGGFHRITGGVSALYGYRQRPTITARSVVQKSNCDRVDATIRAVADIGVDRLSFLAADVTSTAFNRATPWPAERQAEVRLSADDLPKLENAIERAQRTCGSLLDCGFVQNGAASLWRIYDHYAATLGLGAFPPVRCNAPWVSAVLEPDGLVRPCFFHAPYGRTDRAGLDDTVNSPAAVQFRRALDVRTNDICRRCVCTLSLPVFSERSV